MKTILAFLLLFSDDGTFQSGLVGPGDWKTVAECREDMAKKQAKYVELGQTTVAGCFEVTPPNKKAP